MCHTAALARGAGTEEPLEVRPEDLRHALRQRTVGNLVVLAVDASGSMGATNRLAAARGAALSLLHDAYQRRDRVALVSFRGDGAQPVEAALFAAGARRMVPAAMEAATLRE